MINNIVMRKMNKWMQAGVLTLGLAMTSCQGFVDAVLGTEDKPVPTTPVTKEVTLEDALNDGTIVVLTFNLNGEDFYVAFVRVGANRPSQRRTAILRWSTTRLTT